MVKRTVKNHIDNLIPNHLNKGQTIINWNMQYDVEKKLFKDYNFTFLEFLNWSFLYEELWTHGIARFIIWKILGLTWEFQNSSHFNATLITNHRVCWNEKMMILPQLEPIEFVMNMKQVCEPIWLQFHYIYILFIFISLCIFTCPSTQFEELVLVSS
jgi:hypothetical protein